MRSIESFILSGRFNIPILRIIYYLKIMRRSFKQSISTEAQKLLGFSLLIDEFFNEFQQENLESGPTTATIRMGDMLDLMRTKHPLIQESQGNEDSEL